MKKTILTLLVLLIGLAGFGQKSTWLFDKSVKTTSLLGKGIESYDYKLKELLRDPLSESDDIKVEIDTSKLTNSQVNEFQHQAKEFMTSFFKTTPTRITSVTLINPIEYNLRYSTVKKMPRNQYFVYAGQSADSIAFEFAFDRLTNIDIGKALEKITSTLTSAGVDIGKVSEYISLLDSTKIKTTDSLRYKLYMKDPNGLFRVQVLKKKSTTFPPEKYWLHFPMDAQFRNNIDDKITLKYGSPISNTESEKPRYKWYIPKANYVSFKLVVDKDPKTKELKLGIQYKDGGNPITNWFTPKLNDGTKFWDEEKLVYSYKGTKKVRKLVYCKIYAKQMDNNTVEITQIESNGSFRKRTTYLTYPEVKVKYLK